MKKSSAASKKSVLITGAGSGVGRAVAVLLASRGWRVALLGRREEALRETARLCPKSAGKALILPCDVASEKAVKQAVATALERLGSLDALVNAAGNNIPRRSWSEVVPADFVGVLGSNLIGCFYCVQAVLPAMRRDRRGTIVNIVSDAGLRANKKAGVAYVASKFGQAGLTQSLNEEEKENGIRACAIFPGDIDTPMLDKRPVPPPPEARRRMLRAEDVAECVLLALELPPRAVVEHLVIRPAT